MIPGFVSQDAAGGFVQCYLQFARMGSAFPSVLPTLGDRAPLSTHNISLFVPKPSHFGMEGTFRDLVVPQGSSL